jgi:hypothetical protein
MHPHGRIVQVEECCRDSERGCDPDRTRLLVHLSINEDNPSLVRIRLSIRESESQG